MKLNICAILLAATLTGMSVPLAAATEYEANNILVVLDCSHFMNDKWESATRYQIVAPELVAVFNKMNEKPDWGLNIGIRLFGDQSPLKKKNCEDTRRAAPVEWLDPATLSGVLEGIKPKGLATVSKALRAAEKDFPTKHKSPLNYIVLIIAGYDDCKEDLFAAVNFLKNEKKLVKAIHVVGLNLSADDTARFRVMAEKAEGYFVNITARDTLNAELTKVLNELSRDKNGPAAKPSAVQGY